MKSNDFLSWIGKQKLKVASGERLSSSAGYIRIDLGHGWLAEYADRRIGDL